MITLGSQQDFNELWELLDREATEAKMSHRAVIALSRLYGEWNPEIRQSANREFGRWLHSDNARKRFDALALVEQFSIVEADRDLSQLKSRLEGMVGPEAAFELRRVTDVLTTLGRGVNSMSNEKSNEQ